MSYWNKEEAVLHSSLFAKGQSQGRCAQYTRQAIEAGGVPLLRHGSAKDYGASLLAAGFVALDFTPLNYEPGDVVVIDGFEGHPHGHMAMYNGTNWVSDFVQRDLYPGRAYRHHRPPFTVYRHKN